MSSGGSVLRSYGRQDVTSSPEIIFWSLKTSASSSPPTSRWSTIVLARLGGRKVPLAIGIQRILRVQDILQGGLKDLPVSVIHCAAVHRPWLSP